jgi:hypothetical protein
MCHWLAASVALRRGVGKQAKPEKLVCAGCAPEEVSP